MIAVAVVAVVRAALVMAVVRAALVMGVVRATIVVAFAIIMMIAGSGGVAVRLLPVRALRIRA
ncbi:hypothetical protein [Streptomyces sp. NPDC096132]|uniref:hypothetical protein n=1 Tax=Streptomyces sp. NPDC096132 TaxID=3366075 RepID=UPI003826B8D4